MKSVRRVEAYGFEGQTNNWYERREAMDTKV